MSQSYTFAFALLAGIVLFLITIMLFTFSSTIESILNVPITTLLWFMIPALSYAIALGMIMLSQYSICQKTDFEKSLLASIPSAVASMVALVVASFEWFSNPIASVFSYFMIKESDLYPTTNATSCCNRKPLTVKRVESFKTKEANTGDIIKGISYGFYLFFSMLFSIVIGVGKASLC